jgi:biopolymer transport protein ExbD
MRFKRKKEDELIFSIAPLIDMVFLLLIFFMVTSHFHAASGIPIRLPKVGQKASEGAKRELIVAIDREGQIYLKGELTNIKKLAQDLRHLAHKGELDQLVIQADLDVKHGRVIEVMDAAKSGGVTSIVIAAQWDPQKVY